MTFNEQGFGRLGETPERTEIKVGIVKKQVVSDDGVFVDVTILMPDKHDITCRQGAIYGGSGFGFYCPLAEGDEVLVAVPAGATASGAWVVGVAWSRADKPPTAAKQHPSDVILHVRENKNLRINVGGSGQVIIAEGTKGCARVDDPVSGYTSAVAMAASLATVFVPIPLGVPLTDEIPLSAGKVAAGSSKVKVG